MAIRTTAKQTAVSPMDVTNGTVQFWNDPTAAAQQACADVDKLNTALNTANGRAPGEAGATAAGISAIAGSASALFAGGNFGLGIANTVRSGSNSAQVELTITNYSNWPVVAYNCNPTYLDITNMPDPLASGDSDMLVLTQSSFNNSANFTVFLLVGSGPNSSIPFQFEYAYTTDNVSPRWIISAAAGGSDVYDFPKNLQMYGLSFTGNTGYPSFSVYTSNIETGSGVLSLAVYNMASS